MSAETAKSKKSTGVYLSEDIKRQIKERAHKGRVSPWIEEAIMEKLEGKTAPSSGPAGPLSDPLTTLARQLLPARADELELALSGANQNMIMTRLLDSLADLFLDAKEAGIKNTAFKLESRDAVISVTFLKSRESQVKKA